MAHQPKIYVLSRLRDVEGGNLIEAEDYVAVRFGSIDIDLAFADGDEVGISDFVFMSAGHDDAKGDEGIAVEEFEELIFHGRSCSSAVFNDYAQYSIPKKGSQQSGVLHRGMGWSTLPGSI